VDVIYRIEKCMRTKGDYQNQVHSDPMVLKIVRQEAGLCERWQKATQGGPSGSSPLRSGGSRDGQAGRLDPVSGSQRDSS
jgi:hypothetical protein